MFSKWDSLVALLVWHPEWLERQTKTHFQPKAAKKNATFPNGALYRCEWITAAAFTSHTQADIYMHTKNYYSMLNTHQHIFT